MRIYLTLTHVVSMAHCEHIDSRLKIPRELVAKYTTSTGVAALLD